VLVRRRTLAAAIVVIAALVVADLGFFFFRDNFATHYPIKVISQHAWRAGAIPWWNEFDGGGQPLAANPNTLSFYPDNVLYLFLPAHVAFNLHFLLHLALGWFAMRALSRSRFAAWLYVLSGMAMSLLAFYNLVTAFALIPFAWLAVERRSWTGLGIAFGLMALAGEPVTIAGAAIGCAILAWRRMPLTRIAAAIVIAVVIASPLLIAYFEIAPETERGAFRYSARTVLAASFEPQRIVELLAGPLLPVRGPHLFFTLILGLIAIPAVARKSRYLAIAIAMLFLALGRFNPLVSWAVDAWSPLRLGRFPEKFALPMVISFVVLIGAYFLETRFKLLWTIVTFVPLIIWAILTIPIDWFAPYDAGAQLPRRVVGTQMAGAPFPSRAEYRERARRLEPLFGAVTGQRYALDRSPDGMFSVRTRIATERFVATRNPNYARIVTELPYAMIVPRAIAVRDPVPLIESASFDPRTMAAASIDFVSPACPPCGADIPVRAPSPLGAGKNARATRGPAYVVRYGERTVTVDTPAPALLFVNETYFRAWVARADGRELRTLPIDLDRLGILVPAGRSTITLTFGRYHAAIVIAWIISTLLLLTCGADIVLRASGGGDADKNVRATRTSTLPSIEVLDRGAGEVQRTADEDRPVG